MKFTPARGLFRLLMVAVVALVCLPAAKDIALQAICTLFLVGWLLCWIIGGFFDME
jgi:hypothetical protein